MQERKLCIIFFLAKEMKIRAKKVTRFLKTILSLWAKAVFEKSVLSKIENSIRVYSQLVYVAISKKCLNVFIPNEVS